MDDISTLFTGIHGWRKPQETFSSSLKVSTACIYKTTPRTWKKLAFWENFCDKSAFLSPFLSDPICALGREFLLRESDKQEKYPVQFLPSSTSFSRREISCLWQIWSICLLRQEGISTRRRESRLIFLPKSGGKGGKRANESALSSQNHVHISPFSAHAKVREIFFHKQAIFPFWKVALSPSLSRSRSLQVLCPTNKQASELALVLGSQNISYVTPKSLFVSPSFGEMEAENCSLSSQKISS